MTEHLITRPARLTTCPTCHQHTLIATTGGLQIHADPTSLTITQEIVALLSGRLTFDVITWGLPKRMYLEWRDITRIKAGREHAVVALHGCPRTPIPENTGTELTITTPQSTPDNPPF